MRQNGRQTGFTLVELMIVVAVMGIVIASMPIARGYLPEVRVNGFTRSLAMEMREARALAVEYGNDVIVAFDLENSVVNVYSDSDSDGMELADLIRSRPFGYYGNGVAIRSVSSTGVDGTLLSSSIHLGSTSDPVYVTFRSNGSAENAGAIYLAPSDSAKTELGRAIEVLSTGRITMWKFSLSGSPGPWVKWL